MIDLLYKLLIAAGILIILVQLYINHVNMLFIKVVTRLIRLNELGGFDAVHLLKNLEPFMKKLKVKEYGYYVFYLNTEYTRTKVTTKNSVSKFVFSNEFTVFIEIEPDTSRLDSEAMMTVLTEVLFLLIISDINIQLKSAEKAFKKSMELQTFINHDVKNLIQFVNVLEYNMEEIKDESDYFRLIKYLKRSIPGLKIRSDKILAALNSTIPEQDAAPEKVDVADLACITADSYGVDIRNVTGNVREITVNRKSLGIIFENVIKNFYDKSINEKGISFFMDLCETEDSYIVKMGDNGSGIHDCEKIFEPFYSEKINGLGVGLFHCRNVAESMGGSLYAENTENGPVFVLIIRKHV